MTAPSGTPSGSPTPEQLAALYGRESRGDKWYRRGMDLALIAVIVGTIVLLAWTAVRLDARGEYLQTVIATRQAGCECGTPTVP